MTERTEREKMLAGELYKGFDPELVAERQRARRLMQRLNTTLDNDARLPILAELLGRVGENLWIEPPFYVDYGSNIVMGDNVFLNFNCVFLDCNTITIGSNVQIAPLVQLYTATHPTDPAKRLAGDEFALPITIGDNVWIGGGAIIGPGVTIGENTTIGAGSVVTKDIPANVVAVGNPCRVVKKII